MKRKPLVHRPSDDPYRLKGLNEAERQAAMTTAGPPIVQAPEPPPSPTGTPWVSPKILPWLVILFAVCGAVAVKTPDPLPATEVDQHIAVLICAVLGYVSPGLRHKT